MKFAPVMPAKWMPELDTGSYHLVNSNTIDLKDADLMRWIHSRANGSAHWLVLDNGAHELGHGQEELYFEIALEVMPNVIVCPDTPRDADASLDMFEKWIDKCTIYLRNKYVEGVMIVPQGGSPGEWIDNFNFMRTRCRTEYGFEPYIGVPKYLEQWGRIGIIAYLLDCDVGGSHIHVLGTYENFDELVTITEMFPEVRGADSSWPVAYGLSPENFGLMPAWGGVKNVIPDWNGDYEDRGDLIRANIATCRRLIERGGLRELPF